MKIVFTAGRALTWCLSVGILSQAVRTALSTSRLSYRAWPMLDRLGPVFEIIVIASMLLLPYWKSPFRAHPVIAYTAIITVTLIGFLFGLGIVIDVFDHEVEFSDVYWGFAMVVSVVLNALFVVDKMHSSERSS